MQGVSPEAAAAFYRLEQMTGGPLKVNSAYRSPEKNKAVGGAKNSQHVHGNAFDIDVSGMPHDQRVNLINQAREAGFRGIGVYDNALHFDVGPERAWGPSYSGDSLPDWYRQAFGGDAAPAPAQSEQNKLGRFMMLANAMPEWRNSLRGS